MAAERAIIMGGGIGGLAAALALKQRDCEVVIVERDPEPPEIAPETAFEAWPRPGVPQFRHAHILLARVQTLLRDHHPEVLRELATAGIERSALEDGLPESVLPELRPQPGDADLLHLWGRRATFEYVLRRHVGRLPHVRFIHAARVVGLVSEAHGRTLRVTGVEFMHGGVRDRITGDFVIDASGKHTKTPNWLREQGARVEVVSRPSDFVYACRHYRLRDPEARPSRRDTGGNLDYLGFSAFYAEHGHYALTFGCPVDDTELAELLRTPEGFEALCEQFPVLTRWTRVSEPTTKVLGAGRFENRWIRYGVRGGRALIGFFPLGDAYLETNPMYGRGCASAFVQAHVLADALARHADPRARAREYERRTRALLNPYYEISVTTDRVYHTRARLRRGQPVPAPDRVFNHLYENGWLPASHSSVLVAREFLKAVQMREISSPKLRFAMSVEIVRALFRSWLGRGGIALPPPPPPRVEFLRAVTAARRGPPR